MPTSLPPQVLTAVRLIAKLPTGLRTLLGFGGLFLLLSLGTQSDPANMFAYLFIGIAFAVLGGGFHFFRFMHGRFGRTGVLAGVGMLATGTQLAARQVTTMSTGQAGPGISGNLHGSE